MGHNGLQQSTVILLALFLVGLAGCAKNPVTGERQLALISESQEVALGRQANTEVTAQYGTVDDPSLQRYFSDVGQKIAAISDRPDLPWHFAVVDDPVVNAFALPGGFVYFARGILPYMNNEAEMAGVLGHEIGHVAARHAVTQASKAELFSLGLGLGSILSPTFQQFSGLAQQGVGLLFLKYSRDDESQADRIGVRYMYKAGYDPRELSDFFTVFQKLEEKSKGSLPTWLSTHPAPPDRIQRTHQLAAQLVSESGGSSSLQVGRNQFLQQIDGLVYGENPREGFTQDGHFYHPDMQFQLRYPSGWQVSNSKSMVTFVAPSGRVGIQLALAPAEVTSPRARAEELAQQPGVQMQSGESQRISGLSAYVARYQVTDQSGTVVQVLAGFIDKRNQIFEIVGIAAPSDFRQYSSQFREVIGSFAPLSDSRILGVQPDRLDLYTIQRGGTIQDVAGLFPNPRVDARQLALLNRVGPTESLSAGTIVKIVRSGR
ncbi:MAG: M48 family metalloprotease [Acidobacteriota bacterium]